MKRYRVNVEMKALDLANAISAGAVPVQDCLARAGLVGPADRRLAGRAIRDTAQSLLCHHSRRACG